MRSPLLALVPLALLIVEGAGPLPRAAAEDSLSGDLSERSHAIEVVPGIELTTLEVTRTFFNPTFDHQQMSLSIDLPCEAILDGFELRGPDDARGRPTWVPGKLIDPARASDRFFDFRTSADGQAMEGNTLAVLSRDFGCGADLDLFPVPPLRERSVRYRIQLPSHRSEGRYRVELPAFVLDHEGAQLHVAQAPAGFEMAIDDKPVSGEYDLSGRDAHALTFTPLDDHHARVSLASIDLRAIGATREDQSVIAAELDLPLALVDLPPVRRVVVLVDASHSLDADSRTGLQQLAAAYLDALALAQPDARVEVLEFDRHVRRVHGEFVEAELASAQLETAMPTSHNGSEPGLALAEARELLAEARQPGELGVDWVLLLSDLELRDEYSLAAELDAAEASDVRMHVLQPNYGSHSLTPMPADDPWMAIAQASGGAHFGYAISDSVDARDGAELLEPNRVWDLRLIHTDARRRTSVIELAAEIDAGESVQWLERLATPGAERVAFEAFSWASPLTWSAKPTRGAARRWAGRLTAGEGFGIDFEDAESKALAEFAGTITQWTAMIAEAQFDGPSPIGDLWGTGGGWLSSSCGFRTSCGGIGTAHSSGPRIDLSFLRSAIEQALGDCDLPSGSASFEILDREIVVVESADACAREAIWQLDLRSWPSFGHPLVQIAFDEFGVRQFQMTSLYAEEPASAPE